MKKLSVHKFIRVSSTFVFHKIQRSNQNVLCLCQNLLIHKLKVNKALTAKALTDMIKGLCVSVKQTLLPFLQDDLTSKFGV